MKKIAFPKSPGEQMMIEFRDAVLAGRCPPDHVMKFFEGAFEKILKGYADPRTALHLHRGRGRRLTPKQLSSYYRTAYLVARAMDSGMSYGTAIERVAETTKQSEKTVKRRYGEYKEMGHGMIVMRKHLRLSEQQFNQMLGITLP